MVALTALTLTSCSNDDDTNNNITGEGTLKLEFDNIYKTANLANEYTLYQHKWGGSKGVKNEIHR